MSLRYDREGSGFDEGGAIEAADEAAPFGRGGISLQCSDGLVGTVLAFARDASAVMPVPRKRVADAPEIKWLEEATGPVQKERI